MINVGVIGYGYWGPNLVRNFMGGKTRVLYVSDLREERLSLAAKTYPGVVVDKDYRNMLEDPQVNLVAVATPVRAHFDLAMAVLNAGKHLFIEKPMTKTAEQSRQLLAEANKRGLKIFVDHTFIYTGAVKKIRNLIDAGEMGDLYYYDSIRVNLGLFQHDVDVIWDLAVHDLAILDYIVGKSPLSVSAAGISHVPGTPENVAFMTLFYENNFVAHINVNWLAPVKLRQTLIGGSKKMIVFDDLEPSEKIKIYDKGITVTDDEDQIYQMRVGYRTGDMYAPKLDEVEALRDEVNHIVDCLENGATPITGGAMGLRVVEILEAATQSMKQHGAPIELKK